MDLPARAATLQGSQETHGTPDLHIPQRKATSGCEGGGAGERPTHQYGNPTCLESCLPWKSQIFSLTLLSSAASPLEVSLVCFTQGWSPTRLH